MEGQIALNDETGLDRELAGLLWLVPLWCVPVGFVWVWLVLVWLVAVGVV